MNGSGATVELGSLVSSLHFFERTEEMIMGDWLKLLGEVKMKTSRTVMIVESEPSSGRLLSRLIKSEGHSALVARTGSEALILLETLSFDLITLDPGLPDKAGNDFLAELNRRKVETPIIVVSSNPGELVTTEQITAIVTKPFLHAEFVQVIRQQLGQWILRPELN